MKKQLLSVAAVSLLAGSFNTISAEEEKSGLKLVDNVKVKAQIRPRYEMVDTDNTNSNANALTNRLMVGVSGDLAGTDVLSGYVEMTDVRALNSNYYDGGFNGTPNTTNLVADPEQTRLTQAYVDLKMGKTTLRAGRQLFNLDNLRFVGAVAWRQMWQTYDAISLMDNSFEGLNLLASYVTQRNKVVGGAGAKDDTDSLILNAKYKASDALTVTGYGYLIGSVHDTYGLALSGTVPAGDMKVSYRAEYAMQTDASMEAGNNGKPDSDSDYLDLEASVNYQGILAGLQYEVLAADKSGTKAFTTPWATLHKVNGWADKFLGGTPTDGLVDMNIMAGYKSKSFGLFKAIYHDYSSDVGSTDYGTELNLLYTRAVPGIDNLTGMLKYADYDADTLSVDTQKFWVMLDYRFSN